MNISLPEQLNLSHPELYDLILRIGSGTVSYALYSPIEDGSFFYQEIARDKQADVFSRFKDVFFENDYLAAPFRRVFVVNCTSRFTYVPSILSDDSRLNDWIGFNVSDTSGKLLSQNIPNFETIVLHLFPEPEYEFIQRSFVNPQFVHHLTPQVTYLGTKSQLVNGKKMCINLHSDKLDLIGFDRNEWILGNHFQTDNIQDAIYYILYTWKQLKFDQMTDFACITGDLSRVREVTNTLRKYIRKIIPIHITPEGHFSGISTWSVPFEVAALSLI